MSNSFSIFCPKQLNNVSLYRLRKFLDIFFKDFLDVEVDDDSFIFFSILFFFLNKFFF